MRTHFRGSLKVPLERDNFGSIGVFASGHGENSLVLGEQVFSSWPLTRRNRLKVLYKKNFFLWEGNKQKMSNQKKVTVQRELMGKMLITFSRGNELGSIRDYRLR